MKIALIIYGVMIATYILGIVIINAETNRLVKEGKLSKDMNLMKPKVSNFTATIRTILYGIIPVFNFIVGLVYIFSAEKVLQKLMGEYVEESLTEEIKNTSLKITDTKKHVSKFDFEEEFEEL